jgi:hypothetical protein
MYFDYLVKYKFIVSTQHCNKKKYDFIGSDNHWSILRLRKQISDTKFV